MNNKPKLKRLPIKGESLKIPKSIGLGYALFTRFPFLFSLKKSYIKYKKWILLIFPITLFCIGITLFILWWISSYSNIKPPSETIALQSNLINTTTLMVVAFLWSVIVKYRRIMIPRGAGGF